MNVGYTRSQSEVEKVTVDPESPIDLETDTLGPYCMEEKLREGTRMLAKKQQ